MVYGSFTMGSEDYTGGGGLRQKAHDRSESRGRAAAANILRNMVEAAEKSTAIFSELRHGIQGKVSFMAVWGLRPVRVV